MKIFSFLSYRLNRKILLAFLLIIFISVYSRIPEIAEYITEKDYSRLEANLVELYKMNLLDIIE